MCFVNRKEIIKFKGMTKKYPLAEWANRNLSSKVSGRSTFNAGSKFSAECKSLKLGMTKIEELIWVFISLLSHCLPVAHRVPFCHISIGGGDSHCQASFSHRQYSRVVRSMGSGIRLAVLGSQLLLCKPWQASSPHQVSVSSSINMAVILCISFLLLL